MGSGEYTPSSLACFRSPTNGSKPARDQSPPMSLDSSIYLGVKYHQRLCGFNFYKLIVCKILDSLHPGPNTHPALQKLHQASWNPARITSAKQGRSVACADSSRDPGSGDRWNGLWWVFQDLQGMWFWQTLRCITRNVIFRVNIGCPLKSNLICGPKQGSSFEIQCFWNIFEIWGRRFNIMVSIPLGHKLFESVVHWNYHMFFPLYIKLFEDIFIYIAIVWL